MNIFKKDAIWFGMLLGLVIPAILYGILYAVSLALMPQNATQPFTFHWLKVANKFIFRIIRFIFLSYFN